MGDIGDGQGRGEQGNQHYRHRHQITGERDRRVLQSPDGWYNIVAHYPGHVLAMCRISV
jgi:hypothetical protein